MFDRDSKTIQAMAPLLQRVLIVDPQVANAKLLGELMRSMVRCQVWAAATSAKALKLAGAVGPDLMFVELAGEGLDGVDFTRRLRRSTLACRDAPVIMVSGQATAAAILAARDAGVHEFIRKPFTVKDLTRRLEAVTLHPRDWIEAVDYVGPDRRRFNSGDYAGPLKRRSDAPPALEAARTAQALKILRSAIGAVERDPAQALRAMQTQLRDLRKAAAQAGDMRLTTAVIEFARHVEAIEHGGGAQRGDLERKAAALLAYLPREDQSPQAA
ncbi:MAG TPA: response regulator [Phenylobacterium sp.]|uniref:response regulator n=1 Tax=Phenylobacterium sp. TaxID=1871053 RepID=UPI002B823913|nr:response regulator [Phenylobacterium sp.]HSV04566.1 response regulator [Phenylobacterium sp.]